MAEPARPHFGQLVAPPVITIGVVAALLVWELEHAGSAALAVTVAAGGFIVCVLVAYQVKVRIARLSEHYERLLRTADEASQRAEAANRLKDEFLATLSHELRTPLNAVIGWTRLLAGGKLDAVQTRRAIMAIERAGWAQSRLIEDLLDVSRIIRGSLHILARPTSIPPLLEVAVDSLRPAAAARRIGLDVAIDPRVSVVTVDPDRFQQIIWNLLSNAIKFTPHGGRVLVRLGIENEQLALAVMDTGVGFDPDVAEHLFERFRQGDSSTTRQYGGLGLGLGIVRHLAELHGGTVQAESGGPNHGSTFTVLLPMAPAAVPPEPPPAEAAPVLSGVSVLVVDDDPQTLEYLRSTLEHYGAEVDTARSAAEGRTRFARQRPDVLVSDLVMPGGDGLELIRDIRARGVQAGGGTPALALTALARRDDRRQALDAGYQMHVTKPVEPSDLAAAVERLMRRHRDASESPA